MRTPLSPSCRLDLTPSLADRFIISITTGTSPHALRIPPHDGHPALWKFQKDGSTPALTVSGFRLRARLDFSIPAFFPGQRGITPAFGYSAPHPSATGTLTLLNNALAQSAHYESPQTPATACCAFVSLCAAVGGLPTTSNGSPALGSKSSRTCRPCYPESQRMPLLLFQHPSNGIPLLTTGPASPIRLRGYV
jgi:hypothetical protein